MKCPMCGAKEVGPDDSGDNRYGCDECDYVAPAEEFGGKTIIVRDLADMPAEVLLALWAALSHKDKRGHLEIVRREIEKRERVSNRDQANG